MANKRSEKLIPVAGMEPLKKNKVYEFSSFVYIPVTWTRSEGAYLLGKHARFEGETYYSNPKLSSDVGTYNVKVGEKFVLVIKLTEATRRYAGIRFYEAGEEGESDNPLAQGSQKDELDDSFIRGIYFTEEQKLTFDTAYTMANQWGFSTLLLAGDSGNGKTSMPEAYAKDKGMDYVEVNTSLIRDQEEWLGTREFINGETVFVPSAFVEAIKRGNSIICLDEINRVEPWLHGALYTLLSHGRTHHRGELIEVAPNTMFVATMNVGVQFTGTFPLDEALRNRFTLNILVEQLPPLVETYLLNKKIGIDAPVAKTIVEVMGKLREAKIKNDLEYDASTRTSLAIAKMVKAGMTITMGFKNAFRLVDSDTYKNIVDTVTLQV